MKQAYFPSLHTLIVANVTMNVICSFCGTHFDKSAAMCQDYIIHILPV